MMFVVLPIVLEMVLKLPVLVVMVEDAVDVGAVQHVRERPRHRWIQELVQNDVTNSDYRILELGDRFESGAAGKIETFLFLGVLPILISDERDEGD